jgi:hypothetical protein
VRLCTDHAFGTRGARNWAFVQAALHARWVWKPWWPAGLRFNGGL